MGRNPNPFYWFFGIPAFNVAHKFVYMNDLMNTSNNSFRVAQAKESLYSAASTMAASAGAEIGIADSIYIKSALEFLNNTALSERTKEMMVIKDYIGTLRKQLPPTKEFQKILNSIDNGMILENPDSLKDFYIELTRYINVAKTTIEKYKQQLITLKKHTKKNMTELYQDDYRFRAPGDIQALLNNVIGLATQAQQKKEESFSSYIRKATKDYLISSGLISRLQSGEDIAAAMSVIALDIEHQMEEELKKQKLNDFTDLINNNVFDQIIEQYTNAEYSYQTNLQRAINNNEAELDNILDAAKNILNISMITGEKDRNHREKVVANRTSKLRMETSLQKQLHHAYKNNKAIDELKYIEFSAGAKNIAHGNIFELINIVQNGNTIKIKGNAGADTLSLGSFSFELLTPDIQKQLLPFLNQIAQIITKYEKEKKINRKKDQSDIQSQMSEEIDTVIKNIEQYITDFNIPLENLFVYHESLKLYKTAETNSDFSGFHGRDMNIFSYIDKIYSANTVAGLELPNRNTLDFLLLNLSNAAVGGELKSTVENYLSIFAGLLMFDDVQSIAADAAKQLTNEPLGKTKQIHLYNLNGVYVPASMFLSFIYESMQILGQEIEKGYLARATINTSGADAAIDSYLSTRPLPIKPQWETVANSAASGTTIRITFLRAFTSFIDAL